MKVKFKVIKRFYDKTADLVLRKANTELEFTPISIHTFRVEGDCMFTSIFANKSQISIHTFRVEGD